MKRCSEKVGDESASGRGHPQCLALSWSDVSDPEPDWHTRPTSGSRPSMCIKRLLLVRPEGNENTPVPVGGQLAMGTHTHTHTHTYTHLLNQQTTEVLIPQKGGDQRSTEASADLSQMGRPAQRCTRIHL